MRGGNRGKHPELRRPPGISRRNHACPCVCHDGYGGAHPNEACWCKGGRQNQWTHPGGQFAGAVERR